MKHLLCTIVLLAWSTAMAGPVLTIGVGKDILQKGKPFERMVVVGYQFNLTQNIKLRPEFGYWLDTNDNKASSFFVGAPLLLEVASPVGFWIRMGIGPAYVRTVDLRLLGSHFNFDTEFAIGMDDKTLSLCAIFKHFSNAGYRQPNLGRDMIGVQAQYTGWSL